MTFHYFSLSFLRTFLCSLQQGLSGIILGRKRTGFYRLFYSFWDKAILGSHEMVFIILGLHHGIHGLGGLSVERHAIL